MARLDPVLLEKLDQVPGVLSELGIDLWLIFARETSNLHDPSFDLVVGTNVTWHSAFLLSRGGDRLAIVGSLDQANLDAMGHYPRIIPYVGGIGSDLRSALEKVDPGRIAINWSEGDAAADGLTHGMYRNLLSNLAGTPYGSRLESAERIVAALRGRKTPTERSRIRAACDATVGIFDRVSTRLRAGMTEKEFAAIILEEMAASGNLEPAWDPDHCPAVFTGPDSAGAHAAPTGRVIEAGHIVNVDFGVRMNGYCSDLQRTWYVLRPGEQEAPPEVQRGFRTIVEAIQKGARSLFPGRTGAEIDDVVRGHVVDAGYPEYPHGTGHQIGRVAHDGGVGLLPRWERYGTTPMLPVEPGQCFTIEPRLPVAGHGVATCEEIVCVRDGGAEFLSRTQDSLWLVE